MKKAKKLVRKLNLLLEINILLVSVCISPNVK